MTNPNHEVERFDVKGLYGSVLRSMSSGKWVYYSDWEAMRDERDQAKAQALAEVREALKRKIDAADSDAASLTGPTLSRNQGYAQGLEAALSTLEGTQGEEGTDNNDIECLRRVARHARANHELKVALEIEAIIEKRIQGTQGEGT